MKAKPLKWQQISYESASFDRSDGRSIHVWIAAGPHGYSAMAIEGWAITMDSPAILLDGHVHQIIGFFVTAKWAKRYAERFVRRWSTGISIEACNDGKPPISRRKALP